MDRDKNKSGQSLVELALVLPCFCLGVLMAAQLICFCHNLVELQRMAQYSVDRVTYGNYQSTKNYGRFHALWGRFTTPAPNFSTTVPQPWRPFHGVSTISETGQLFRVRVDSQLLPGDGFTSVLPIVSEQGYADTFVEPPLPAEQ